MEVMIIIPIIILFIVIWIISSIKTDDSLNDGHKKPIHKDEEGEKHSYKSPIYDEEKKSWKDSYNDDPSSSASSASSASDYSDYSSDYSDYSSDYSDYSDYSSSSSSDDPSSESE